MKKRSILSLACALALTAALAQPARAVGTGFVDVPGDAWYAEAVHAAADRGLMTGVSADRFSPDGAVTRATVLTVLWRLEGSPEPAGAESFPDAESGAWYDFAVRWAKEQGIAAGYADGTLGVDDPVTREQLAVFLGRYAAWKGETLAEGVLSLYPDGDAVSPWAVDGMRHAVGAGLITGTGEGTLSPLGYTTRAALAVVLQRLLTPALG